MDFIPRHPFFFNKTMKGYQSVGNPSERSSSEDNRSSDDGLLEKEIRSIRQKNSFWRKHLVLIIINSVILVLYVVVLILVAESARSQALHGPQLLASPAQKVIKWETKKFVENSQSHGPFSGYPREEIDQNWRDLLNDENIIIESEYMKAYGREDYGVADPEGRGYLGTLNVYHELHCIKRIYQYMYQEHYWKDLDDRQREINRLHNEHCLDFLRQSVMCHGDIGIVTFQWTPDSLIPVSNATVHECVNWDAIHKWTKERTVDMMKPGWLVHPTKGPAYPLGEGSRLGAVKASPPESPHPAGLHAALHGGH